MKLSRESRGNCLFFSALLGTVALLCCLFILGIPKFVIGVEYWNSCPLSPIVPVYLTGTGLLAVLSVGHSLFLWTCLYKKQMKKKRTHTACLLFWACLMILVPVGQIAGSPYIIKAYQRNLSKQAACRLNLTNSGTREVPSPETEQTTAMVVLPAGNHSEPSYATNHKNLTQPDVTSENHSTKACEYCNHVLILSAYITIVFELVFVTLPMLCLVIGAVVFRLKSSAPDV